MSSWYAPKPLTLPFPNPGLHVGTHCALVRRMKCDLSRERGSGVGIRYRFGPPAPYLIVAQTAWHHSKAPWSVVGGRPRVPYVSAVHVPANRSSAAKGDGVICCLAERGRDRCAGDAAPITSAISRRTPCDHLRWTCQVGNPHRVQTTPVKRHIHECVAASVGTHDGATSQLPIHTAPERDTVPGKVAPSVLHTT